MLQYNFVISRFRRDVNEIFVLLEFYAASIDSYLRFGITYRPIFKGQAVETA
jgi:hypothetical protein